MSDDGVLVRCRVRGYDNVPTWEVISDVAELTVEGIDNPWRFDDIPGLVCYWSAEPTENVITKSGDTVISVAPAYGGSTFPLTPIEDLILHNSDTYQIGVMPAFRDPTDSDLRDALAGTFNDPKIPGEITIVTTHQLDTVTSITGPSVWNLANNANAGITRLFSGGNSNHSVWAGGSAINTGITRTTEPEISVFTWDSSQEDSSTFYINGEQANSYSFTDRLEDAGHVAFMGRNAGVGNSGMAGRMSIMCIYDRILTEGEIQTVTTACQFWIDNGHAPGGGGGTGEPEWLPIDDVTIFQSEADTYERDMNDYVVSETPLEGWTTTDGDITQNGILTVIGTTPGTWPSQQTVTNEFGTTQGDEWDLTILPSEGTLNISWVPPTERTDGSTLVPIDTYLIEYGELGDALDSLIVPGSETSVALTDLNSGEIYRVRISCTDTDGKTSQLSGFVYGVAS